MEINYLGGYVTAALEKAKCTAFSGPCMGAFEESFEKAIGQLRDNTADLSKYAETTGNKPGQG